MADLQKTYIISADGDFHLDQADSGYNAKYTVQYYSAKATTIPIKASFSGTYRVVINDTEQLNSVGTGSIQVRPGWNRIDIYYYTPDGGALYIQGASKPLGHYFTMWRDPSPSAPVWTSTSGYDGVTEQEGQVELKWENAYGISVDGGTEIHYQESGDASFTFLESVPPTVGTQSFTHVGLNGSTTYVYKLRHFTAQGDLSDYTAERNGVVAADVPAGGVIPSSVDVLDSDIYYASGEVVSIEVRFSYRLTAAPTVTVGGSAASLVADTSTDHTYTTWSFTATGSEGTIEIAASATTVHGSAVSGTKDIVFDFTAPVLVSGDLVLDSNSNIGDGDALYCVDPRQIFIRAVESVSDSSGVPTLRLLNAFTGTGSSAGAGVLTDANLATADFNSVSFSNYILTDSDGVEHTITSYAGDPLIWTVSGTPVNGAYTVSKYSRTVTTSWDEVDFLQNADISYSLLKLTPWSISTIPDSMKIDNGFRVYMAALDNADNISSIISDDILYNTDALSAPTVTHQFRNATDQVFKNENDWYNDSELNIRITAATTNGVMPVKSIFYSIDGAAFTESSIDDVSGAVDVELLQTNTTVEYYATTNAFNGSMQSTLVNFQYDKTAPTWEISDPSLIGTWEKIILSWGNDPVDTGAGISHINAYRHTSDVSSGATLIAQVDYENRGYVDPNPTAGVPYYYWVSAVDYAGNETALQDMGGPVEVNRIIITSKFMSGASGEVEIFENEDGWMNEASAFIRMTATTLNGGVDIKRIYSSLDDAAWASGGTASGTVEVDVTLAEVANGNVRFYAETANMTSETVKVLYSYDKTIPEWTPGGLPGVGGFERIILGWTSGATDSLSGVKHLEIHRNTADASSGATLIAITDNGYVGFIDSEVDYGVNEYYWGKAVDYAGNKSDFIDIGGPLAAEQIVSADVDGALRIENPSNTPSGSTLWKVRYGIRVPIEAATVTVGTLSGVSTITDVGYATGDASYATVSNPEVNGVAITFPYTITSDTTCTITFDPVQDMSFWEVTFDATIGSEISGVKFDSILAADLIEAGVLRLETGLTIWSGGYNASGDASGGGVAIDSGGLELWDATGGTTVALYGTAVGGNIAVFGKNSGRQVFITEGGDVLIDGGSLTVGSGKNLVRDSDFSASGTVWTFGTGLSLATTGGLIGSNCIYANRGKTTGFLLSGSIYVDNSKEYLGSVFYKKLLTWVDMRLDLSIGQYTEADALIGATAIIASASAGTTDWQRLEGSTGALDSTCSYIILYVRFTDIGASQDIDAILDGFQLEEISHSDQEASPWSPAGVTVIDGANITTGKIQSTDGSSYFDLDNSVINIDDSTGGTAIILSGGSTGDIAVFGSTAGKQVKVEADGDVVVEGGTVKTGKIESIDGSTYFDLDNSIINIDDSTGGTAIAFNGGATGDLAVLGSTAGKQVKVDTDGNVIIDGGALTIGSGVNLVPGSNFETIAHWSIGADWSLSDTVSKFGSNSAKVVATGATTGNLISGYIPINIYNTYCASLFHYFSAYAAGNLRVLIQEYDKNKAYLSGSTKTVMDISSPSTSTWVRENDYIILPYESGVTNNFYSVSAKYLRFIVSGITSPDFTAYVDGFQVEEVDNDAQVASPWGPAGVTVIDGDEITTGKIQSADETTYFDLDNNKIVVDDGTGTVELSATNGLIGSYDGKEMFDLGIRDGSAFFRGGILSGRLTRMPEFATTFGFTADTTGIELASLSSGYIEQTIVAEGFIWAAGDSLYKINRFDGTVEATYTPTGTTTVSKLVYDGNGHIWCGGRDAPTTAKNLVRFNIASGTFDKNIDLSGIDGGLYVWGIAYDTVNSYIWFSSTSVDGTQETRFRYLDTSDDSLSYVTLTLETANDQQVGNVCFDGTYIWTTTNIFSPYITSSYHRVAVSNLAVSDWVTGLSYFTGNDIRYDGVSIWIANGYNGVGGAHYRIIRIDDPWEATPNFTEYFSTASTSGCHGLVFDGRYIYWRSRTVLNVLDINSGLTSEILNVTLASNWGYGCFDGVNTWQPDHTSIWRI